MSDESSKIQKVNFETFSEDCLFEVMDRLPTNYLYTIALTCTRLYDLAAIQYRRKHPEKYVCFTVIDDKIVLLPDEYDVKLFGRKFLNVIIRGESRNVALEEELIDYIRESCSPNMRIIRFEEAMLLGEQLNRLADMLQRVETLVLNKCGMNEDFYDCLLSKCHRLKHLIISDSYTIIDPDGSKWMEMNYPLLESVQICSIPMLLNQRERWELFFRRNPQIKRFSCDNWYVEDVINRPVKVMRQFAPNLTHLFLSLRGIGHLNSTYYDLSILCERRQFQRLELQFSGQTGIQYMHRHAKQMLSTIKKLHAIHLTNVLLTKEAAAEIAWIQSLKQLNFENVSLSADFAEKLAQNLHGLEEIFADSVIDVTPFIRLAPNLRKIELSNTEIGTLNLGWGLLWLNDERTTVTGACPITIYVKNTAMDGVEQTIITNGIIAIKPITQDKRILAKVKHTFVEIIPQ